MDRCDTTLHIEYTIPVTALNAESLFPLITRSAHWLLYIYIHFCLLAHSILTGVLHCDSIFRSNALCGSPELCDVTDSSLGMGSIRKFATTQNLPRTPALRAWPALGAMVKRVKVEQQGITTNIVQGNELSFPSATAGR
jgi:hypothetical protein